MELHNDKLIVGNGPETRTLNNPTSFHAVYGGKKNKRKTRKLKKRKGGSTPTSSSSTSSRMTPREFINISLEQTIPGEVNRKNINEILENDSKREIDKLKSFSINDLKKERKDILKFIQKIRKMSQHQKDIFRNAELAGDRKALNDLQSINNHISTLGLEHTNNLQYYINILSYIDNRIKELEKPTISQKANDESNKAMIELLAEEASKKKTPPPSSTKKKKPKSKKK